MTYEGYGDGGTYDPFGDGSSSPAPPPQDPNWPRHQDPASANANTAATLCLIFAFVLPPAGVVLGHLALSQIKHRRQRGHDRAVVGLTLSYVFILVAIIALAVWKVTGPQKQTHPPIGSTTAISTTMTPIPTPSVSTTVITPPAQARPKVSVEDLRVGDCVEVQQTRPDPNIREDQDVNIFRVRCERRDEVFRVDSISSPTNTCSGRALINSTEVLFACISPVKD
jgi:heme/copper-type cytochrome/quinol oxidase subunit 2